MATTTGGSWRDASDDPYWEGVPKFGRKARGWFYRSIYHGIRKHLTSYSVLEVEDLDAVAAWFLANADDSVSRKDEVTFHGPRFSVGALVINWEEICAAWREQRSVIRAEMARKADAE